MLTVLTEQEAALLHSHEATENVGTDLGPVLVVKVLGEGLLGLYFDGFYFLQKTR